MRMVSGVFNGTGAAVYICCGFIPDFVRVLALGDDKAGNLFWRKGFRLAKINEGVLDTNGNTDFTLKTFGAGIAPYYGGDILTEDNQTSVTYGEGVFLGPDDFDYKNSQTAKGNAGDGVATDITTWTLDTSGNRTGHFDEDVVGTYIANGSPIVIDGKDYLIEAVTAAQGEAADEVTLNYAVPSGDVHYIGGKYGYKPIPIGEITSKGFLLSMTTVVNVNNELQYFEAGIYNG